MKYTHVSKDNLAEVTERLESKELIVFDSETTGLDAYLKAKIFSLALCDGDECYYFNFVEYPGLDPKFVLTPKDVEPITGTLKHWVAHNAKFDMHFTDRAGIKPFGRVIDTEVLARIFENHHQYSGGYSLDACVKRWLGLEKDDRVKKYMDEYGLYHTVHGLDGKEYKNYHFDKVPFEIISVYAMKDAELTMRLYLYLMERMYKESEGVPNKAWSIELSLTPVLFEMEKRGVLVDVEYCREQLQLETARAKKASDEITKWLRAEFVDSAQVLAPWFEKELGRALPTTEKGTAQITEEVLSQIAVWENLNDGPAGHVANMVLEYREATKRATTYYGNYLTMVDSENVIHPNFRQAGTTTGRMACNNPNLQNIPPEVRRAFIPRPDHIFVSIDYKQMEFRLMLDYAGQEDLIEKIKQGEDPHDSTAALTGIERKAAKTLNFGILYRMGLAKLGKALGITEATAGDFRKQYFARMPKVKRFIYEAPKSQERRGFTFSWAGRRFYLDGARNEDGSFKWSFKAANAIIQGGCADVCKLAMVEVSRYLGMHRSRMVLQVHDECLFEVHKSELHIIETLKSIMESAYPYRSLPLTCSVAYSEVSFHDMVEIDDAAKIAELIQL